MIGGCAFSFDDVNARAGGGREERVSGGWFGGSRCQWRGRSRARVSASPLVKTTVKVVWSRC